MAVWAQDDGTLIAQAPVCSGDTLERAGVFMSIDTISHGYVYGDQDEVLTHDVILTLDLSPSALISGDSTTQWPQLERPPLDLSAGLPGDAELAVTTGQSFVGLYLRDLHVTPGNAVLVMGRATRARDADRITVTDPDSARSVVQTWCADHRSE